MVLAAFIFASCEEESIHDSFDFGIEKSFQINGEYLSMDNSLRFTITNIEDSRCPSDVVCVWEGKADITIEVEATVKETIVLSTYNNLIDTVGNYSFELKEISPYPVSTKTIELEDYDVTLKIEKL